MKLSKQQAAMLRFARDPSARARGGFWITLLINVALFVLADLLRPKPKIENAKPSGLGDFRFPTATEGRVIPLVWGTVRISGPNTVWHGDLVQEAIMVKVKTGLFSSERQTTGYRYYLGIQSAFCMGELTDMTKVWIGDELVADYTSSPIVDGGTYTINKPDLFGGEKLGAGGVVGTLRFFAGSNSQPVSAYLSGSRAVSATVGAAGTGYSLNDVVTEAGDGTASERATFRVTGLSGSTVTAVELISGGTYSVESSSPAATTSSPGTGLTLTLSFGAGFQSVDGVTPAYHDIAYTAPDAAPVLYGTSTNIKAWAWEVRRFPNALGLTGGKEIVDGGANPAAALYEILLNADWGQGEPSASVDTSSFSAAADTLFNEGNGFAFILDKPEDVGDLINRIEQQIDGILFQHPVTGLWSIKLIRADYNILTVPEVNVTNVLDIVTFTRSTYEATSNTVRVPYNQADDDYKDTNGFAQDMANILIVGANVSSNISHPGVKTAQLASDIAWRELRVLSIPLAQGEFVVDRSLYGLLPGDVFGFTDPDIGFVRLPMRVRAIDYGNILEGKIKITAVQDLFFAAAGVFDPNPASQSVALDASLVAIPSNQQLAFEAPRALTLRDPGSVDATTDKVFAAARKQGPEVSFKMVERNHPTTPTGTFEEFGEVFQFMLLGKLTSSLSVTATNPLSSMVIEPAPDTQAAVVNAFPSSVDLNERGTDLISLCYIGDTNGDNGEFILVGSAQSNASNVQLNSVYRGVLDSVQREHASGATVFLIFSGAGMSDDTVLAGNKVEVKLLPRAARATLADGLATSIDFTMDNRTRRPYPPSSFDLNNTTLDATSVDLDGSGSGEDVGILVDEILRRDFRLVDEIAALAVDAGASVPDFPTANMTTVEIEVRDGVTVLVSTTGISGNSATMRKYDVLAGLDTTTLPASLSIAVRQSHTFNGTVYKSRDYLVQTFTIVDPLIGKHAWGELDDSEASSSDFTVVADTVDHVFSLSTAFTVGAVEYRLNGGSWVNLITAGGTSGTILAAAIANTDTIGIRHLSSDTAPQKLITMTVSGTPEAYGILIS